MHYTSLNWSIYGAFFFMENFLKGLNFSQQVKSGTFRTVFRGDIATPMIATKDIGEVAAKILLDEPFSQPRVRVLLGALDYTMKEVIAFFR